MKRKNKFLKIFLAVLCLIFLCEFSIYYVVLIQCSWPILVETHEDKYIHMNSGHEKPVKAMFIADIHILGTVHGHWFDRLRREWQMHKSFQTALTLFQPEVVFILGDIFDGGLRSNDFEFDYYMRRLESLFYVPKNIKLYIVAGNHDVGFHYNIYPYIYDRFVSELKSPSIKFISLRGNHFILINSMAMEGDGCFLCKSAQKELHKIAKRLKCARGIGKCFSSKIIDQYSRPILLQHFPMYRSSDKLCSEPDQAPDSVKMQQFHERWDCLSRESSEMIYSNLNPRVIIGGHTHHGCHVVHHEDIHEYTIPSFNWRYKNNPTFLLGQFLPNNFAISKCHLPQESTVIFLYGVGIFFILLWIILLFMPSRVHHRYRMKLD